MARKKAHHTVACRRWRSITLKYSLFIFFLFSISVFITPGAVAKDFFDLGGIAPPRLFLSDESAEPQMTGELAERLLTVAPTFEPLEASAGPETVSEENKDSGNGGVEEDGEDARDLKEEAPPKPPSYEAKSFVAPDITRGPKDRMELSITFDGGGYDDKGALEILKVLRERGIKTTIFLTGRFISRYPEITRQIVEDGHEVGNHTFVHPHLTEFARKFRQKTLKGVDKNFLAAELEKTDELFKKATGAGMAPLWRAPYGEENAEIRRWALDKGYVHVGWTYGNGESLDTLDWVDDTSSRFYRSPEEIKERVFKFGRNGEGVKGGIILMHLSTKRKPGRMSAMLAELLDGLMGQGYRFVKVSELMRDDSVLKAMEDRRVNEVAGRLAENTTAGEESVEKTPAGPKALNRAQARRDSSSHVPL